MIWHHNPITKTWSATSGIWHAVVVRLSGSREWYPYVTRSYTPFERHDGPHCHWPGEGRAWCEEAVQRLEMAEQGSGANE
jgi:hypothetical protein